MDEKHSLQIEGIDAGDWEKTPASVRNLVVKLIGRIEQLELHLKELQLANEQISEKVNRNSQNSNSSSANDPLNVEMPKKKKKTGKKRGGQPGHKGHNRFLYPVSECREVTNYYPSTCSGCGETLTGIDSQPYRHQVVEIPPVKLDLIEARLHQLTCHNCRQKTRATLPSSIEKSGYGERVVGIVSLLSGEYRHSHRMVVEAMSDLFGLNIALGTVNRLRNEASESVSQTVDEAQVYVQRQPIVGADETSFKQGNADGRNPQEKKAWLWVAVTPLVTFFQVMLARSTEAAQSLLGQDFKGILLG